MLMALLPLSASAQYTQLLPPEVKEIRLEGYVRLTVRPGDTTRLEVSDAKQAVNVGKVSGSRLTLKEQVRGLTLYVSPERTMAFNPQDFSSLTFSGDFQPFDHLTIHTEDYGKASIFGSDGDTLRSHALRLHAEDFSRIEGSIPVQYYDFDIISADHSRISFLATASDSRLARDGETGCTNTFANSEFGTIYLGRYTVDGELKSEDYYSTSADESTRTINALTDRIADMGRKKHENENHNSWHSGDFDLDFAWGWHNWGSEMFSGFGGTEGPAEVGTTFGNIQLTGMWGIANSKWLGLRAGLGLEWDRWKFTTPQAVFSTSTVPNYSFVDGGASSGRTMLITRYVVVPISIRIGNANNVHLELSAIPGIHWNASGLRYKHTTADRTVTDKDRSINRYINPYKLDLRAILWYKNIGVYAQFSTQSVFKNTCDDLIPVRIGFIL